MTRKTIKPSKWEGKPGWVESDSYQLSPQVILNKGDKCRIKGQQGTFTFHGHTTNTNLPEDNEWVDLWGGAYGREQWVAVRPDRLKHIPTRRKKKKEPQPPK